MTSLLLLLLSVFITIYKLAAQSIDLPSEQQVNSPIIEKEITFIINHKINNDFIHRTTAHIIRKPDGKQGLLFSEKNVIIGDDIEIVKSKLITNELYTIQIQANIGNFSSHPIITSIPMCELQKSGFKEDILVYLDNKNSVIGVSYSSPSATIARDCDASKIKDKINFQTRLKIADRVVAQSIPVQAIGIVPPMFKDIKLEASDDINNIQKPPPQTFFQKYWFYILFAVFYLITGIISGVYAKDKTPANSTAK